MATEPDRPKILELRIHGVNNTPPESLLDLPSDEVRKLRGDDLGSFWGPTASALEKLGPSDRGWVPPGVTREAYSWGGMARTSPPGLGPGVAKSAVLLLARIGWVLLMPFGLANVAFWSRVPRPMERPSGRKTMRVFGLVLTLVFAAAAMSVTVDMVALQCLGGEGGCSAMPGLIEGFRAWPQGQRVLIAVVAALAIVALPAGLSLLTNSRYEAVVPAPATPPDPSLGRIPRLTRPRFWAQPKDTRHLLVVHFGAAVSLVTLMVVVHRMLGGVGVCRPTSNDGGRAVSLVDCYRSAGLYWQAHPTSWTIGWLVAGIAGVIGLLAAVVLLLLGPMADRADDLPTVSRRTPMTSMRWTIACVIGPIVSFVALSLVLLEDHTAFITAGVVGGQSVQIVREALPDGPLVGVQLVLLVLIGLGLTMVASAWFWETVQGSWASAAVFGLGLGAVVAIMALGTWHTIAALIAAAGITIVVVASVVRSWLASGTRMLAFGGRAPVVLMLLALGLSVLFSSVAVLAFGDLLNDCYTPRDLLPWVSSPALADCTSGLHASGAAVVPVDIASPGVLLVAAAGLAPSMAVAGVIAAVSLGLWMRFSPGPAPVPAGSSDLSDPLWSTDAPTTSASGVAESPEVDDGLAHQRLIKRRIAAVAQRAEAIGAIAAGLVLIDLLVAVGLATSGSRVPEFDGWLMNASLALAAFVAVAVVAALVGGTITGGKRPLGLIWDLVCFLPRDGHPLAPPCYAERAVPEVIGRLRSWVLATDIPNPADRPTDRSVVISAHSLGGVLAVAALLQCEPSVQDRVALLTYGSQLRAYFSRLFPMLLGPEVLGTVPCGPGRMTRLDPWVDERSRVPSGLPRFPDPLSVRGILSRPVAGRAETRWVNLWRATDPLGMPVDDGYSAGAAAKIDHGCDEVDPSGYMPVVGTHAGYPRTRQYRAALRDLTAALNAQSG